jgi:hypothetical protein
MGSNILYTIIKIYRDACCVLFAVHWFLMKQKWNRAAVGAGHGGGKEETKDGAGFVGYQLARRRPAIINRLANCRLCCTARCWINGTSSDLVCYKQSMEPISWLGKAKSKNVAYESELNPVSSSSSIPSSLRYS